MSERKRVVVVGAGITGLVAAYRLTRPRNGDRPPEVIVLEAGDRCGGKLRTIELDGIQMEAGADSFVVRKPWAVELCTELGLGDDLVRPGAEGASVWSGGRLVPLPEPAAFGIPSGVAALLRWPGLSLRGRLRAMSDVYRRSGRGESDESLGSLIRRRMGAEALRVLVGPILGGIHAGDPDRLSLLATFPELRDWERGHDSLIRGARAAVRAAARDAASSPERRALFATLWSGLSGLVGSLEGAIGPENVWLGAPVSTVQPGASPATEGRYAVLAGKEPLEADAVVLATPAPQAARQLGSVNPSAAEELRAIRYASTAVVLLVYERGDLPQGTGFVVPIGERTITACTWVSRKWPRPEHSGRAVIRCYVGRAGDEAALDLTDDALAARVAREVEEACGLDGPPQVRRVVRWPEAMPQYDVGHGDRVGRIERTLAERTPGLVVAGSAYRGVGVSDCVRQGIEAADRVAAFLHGRSETVPAAPIGNGETREATTWTT